MNELYAEDVNENEYGEKEPEMIESVQNNSNASAEEILNHFNEITPDGLPPCASEWDDDEDDE